MAGSRVCPINHGCYTASSGHRAYCPTEFLNLVKGTAFDGAEIQKNGKSLLASLFYKNSERYSWKETTSKEGLQVS